MAEDLDRPVEVEGAQRRPPHVGLRPRVAVEVPHLQAHPQNIDARKDNWMEGYVDAWLGMDAFTEFIEALERSSTVEEPHMQAVAHAGYGNGHSKRS